MDYKSVSAAGWLVVAVFAALGALSLTERGRSPSTESRDSVTSQATGEILLRR